MIEGRVNTSNILIFSSNIMEKENNFMFISLNINVSNASTNLVYYKTVLIPQKCNATHSRASSYCLSVYLIETKRSWMEIFVKSTILTSLFY